MFHYFKGCRTIFLAPGKHPTLLVGARVQKDMDTMQSPANSMDCELL